ncbi:hypothetical protein DER45DRAFT_544926 [Fusarium avenaceum]|nr:hypothetical protein DER45DRAFT_544926 [Fusarium avenaceum]
MDYHRLMTWGFHDCKKGVCYRSYNRYSPEVEIFYSRDTPQFGDLGYIASSCRADLKTTAKALKQSSATPFAPQLETDSTLDADHQIFTAGCVPPNNSVNSIKAVFLVISNREEFSQRQIQLSPNPSRLTRLPSVETLDGGNVSPLDDPQDTPCNEKDIGYGNLECQPSGGDGYSDSYKTLHTELGYEFLTFRTRIKMRQQVLLSLVDKLMMVKINFTIATDCIPASKSGKPKQINTALPYYQTLDGIEL